MKKYSLTDVLLLASVFILSGCVVRTYKVTKDRVDQDLSAGNRGYLEGQAPAAETKARPSTRTTQVVEVELQSPFKFEKKAKAKALVVEPAAIAPPREDESLWGNRGFITESVTPEIAQREALEKYTVQKNDTLQKISKKFYGTTKKWTKIYQANRDILKAPDKIYPGQTINIPLETLKEAKEHLK